MSFSHLDLRTSSFSEFASQAAPEVLPKFDVGADANLPHGTTIVAASFSDGVVMAGDRRATMGNIIAQRDIEKVFAADEYSIIGIAGVAGLAIEFVRLFQLELAHYEKIEGTLLSLDGKANRLSTMIRANLPQTLAGLGVLPLFAGWDQHRNLGRIFSYDGAGGRYEEHSFYAVGSGAYFARGALKKLYRPDFTQAEATTAVIQALVDAADDDAATAGPDLTRKIYPVVLSASSAGVERIDVAELADDIMRARMNRPDGPQAEVV